MQEGGQKLRGFTIVELLIVVVVIAILAAITIVSYNGIQNRAKDTVAKSAISEAGKKAVLYALTNTDGYPDVSSYRTAFSLPEDTDQAAYTYIVSDDRKSFCLSLTGPTKSYAYTQAGSVADGKCITNVTTNPSVETSAAGWSTAWAAGTGVNATASVPTDGGQSGASYRRWVIGGTNTTNGTAILGPTVNIGAETRVTMSYWVRSSAVSSIGIIMNRYTSADGAGTNTALTANLAATSPVDTWVRRTGTFVTDGFLSVRPGLRVATGGVAADQVIDADSVMMTLGTVDYAYRDGSSPDWAWTGTPHASTSFGPGVPNN